MLWVRKAFGTGSLQRSTGLSFFMPKKQTPAWQATSLTFRNGWCDSGNCSETKFSAMMKRRFCRPKTGRFPELEAKLVAFFIEIRNLILPVTSETVTQQARVCFGRVDMKDKLQSHQGLGIKIYQEGLFGAHRNVWPDFPFKRETSLPLFYCFLFSLTPRGLSS